MKITKIIIFLISASFLIYSTLFEAFQLEETFHEVTIGTSGKQIKIAHLSDLHTKGLGTLERKLIEAIRAQKPDLILITGDIATPNGSTTGYEEVLSQLKAPLGVYFVQGNWEYWEPIKELQGIFKKTNIVDLTNKMTHIKDDLWLVGLDDEFAGSPQIEIYEKIPKQTKILSMFHSPALFDSINKKSDLAFAGHSHGGQIRIPFIGQIWTPGGTGRYVAGWFKEGESKLYVSRGIGTSILPIRFNCYPEIAFIKVNY